MIQANQDRVTTQLPLRSEQINELAAALAKAQGEFAVPQKKRKAKVQMRVEKGGGTYEYNYADLADIMAAIVPALSKHGLALMQPIDADAVRLTTLLVHSSGQFYSATYDLPTGLTAQAFGSALTYARRYSLSLVGIVAEEDDDAGVAQSYTQRQQKNAKTSPMVKPKGAPIVNGTSAPNLVPPPVGMTHEEVMKRVTETYHPLMKLLPEFDIAGHIYGKYGAQNRKDLRPEEAWDLLQFMETTLKQGVAS